MHTWFYLARVWHIFIFRCYYKYGVSQAITAHFDVCDPMSRGNVVLVFLYRELYKLFTMETTQLYICQSLLQVNIMQLNVFIIIT